MKEASNDFDSEGNTYVDEKETVPYNSFCACRGCCFSYDFRSCAGGTEGGGRGRGV